jgi:NAD(P)H-hydrate repair Nnr-like enzyme with NAD(P)H-hydrate dehydratase domain
MDYWQKQGSEPLFPDLLWSRPENKRTAGKLLIIGGNLHNFSAPGQAYEAATQAGTGTAKVLLPEGLRKTIGAVLENCEFAPMNKSGSFAKEALAEWLEWAAWADGVVLAGDIGRNSETAIVTEQFLKHYRGQLTITQDALDQFRDDPKALFQRPQTTIVASFGQLQKMWPKITTDGRVIRYGNSLTQNLDILHTTAQETPPNLVTKQHDDIAVIVQGKISTTRNEDEIWRVSTAATMATWWLQNPGKPFEALTTAIST